MDTLIIHESFEPRERQSWERAWLEPYLKQWRVRDGLNDVGPRYFANREDAQAYADSCNFWRDPAYEGSR